MSFLEVKDLRTWFPIRRGVLARTVGQVRAVDGVSLSLAAGETLGLVGESGCGKTTLARTILSLERPRTGTVHFEGHELTAMSERHMRPFRRRIQVVFQDPFASLNPRMTVRDIVTEGQLLHGMITAGERDGEALRVLKEVGLDEDAMYRYPHEFSGGQRQRISVARAIAVRPSLVVCDEAVSALDVSVQAQVINLLADLREKHQLAYLFISHDLSVVRHISHRVAVMYLGQIVESGPAEAVMQSPRHPYTRALVSAVPRVGGDRSGRIVLKGDVPSPAAPPPGCRFHPRCPFATEACRRTEPVLEPDGKTGDREVACIRKDEI